MSSKRGLRTLIVGCLRVHTQGLVPNNAKMQQILFIHIADVLSFLQLSESVHCPPRSRFKFYVFASKYKLYCLLDIYTKKMRLWKNVNVCFGLKGV